MITVISSEAPTGQARNLKLEFRQKNEIPRRSLPDFVGQAGAPRNDNDLGFFRSLCVIKKENHYTS
jgi:hypothetical protein